jgi:hypothetical protein
MQEASVPKAMPVEASVKRFESHEEVRVWVSFAGEALNGLLACSPESSDAPSMAAAAADALLEEYRARMAASR